MNTPLISLSYSSSKPLSTVPPLKTSARSYVFQLENKFRDRWGRPSCNTPQEDEQITRLKKTSQNVPPGSHLSGPEIQKATQAQSTHTGGIESILARFAPSIPMIKKDIESLIEKAYIKRTANTTDEYSYMACSHFSYTTSSLILLEHNTFYPQYQP